MSTVDAFPAVNLGPAVNNADQHSYVQSQQDTRVPDPYETTDEVGDPVTDSDGRVIGLDYRQAVASHEYQTPLYHAVPAGGTLAEPIRAS